MDALKKFLAAHNITTHSVAVFIAFLWGCYHTIPAFHAYADSLYHLTPHWMKEAVAGLGPVIMLYWNSRKKWTDAQRAQQLTPQDPPAARSAGVGLVVVLLAFALCAGAKAQTTLPDAPSATQSQPDGANVYGFGASFNNTGVPAVAGSGFYAHSFTDGTYAFTICDVLPNTRRPLTVTTNCAVGIAQRLTTIGKFPVYIPTAAGISWNGSNTGWAWSTGGMTFIPLKKYPGWCLAPSVRVAKSSVSNGTGYQPIFGVMAVYGCKQ